MKVICLTFFILFCFQGVSQNSDSTYFNKNWEPCQKEKHKFYRVVKLLDSTYYLEDYYANGKMLMSGGYVKSDSTLSILKSVRKHKLLETGEFKRFKKSGRIYESSIENPLNYASKISNLEDYSIQNSDFEKYDLSFYTYYYKNGKIMATGFITNKQMAHGIWKYYEKKTGKLWLIREYQNGIYNGIFSYYLNDILYLEEEYESGVILKKKKYNSLNGKLKSISIYEDGKLIKTTEY